MKLRLDDIKEEGIRLSIEWDRNNLSLFMAPKDPYEIDFEKPLDVDLFFEKRASYVHVSGAVHGQLVVTCHRCLDRFPWRLDLPVETFLYSKAVINVPEDEEIELKDDDLEEEFFDGEEIDVDLIIAEEIFLSLPQVLLCSEDCKGLCARCGANLNRESCKCQKTSDSPFAALLQRKNQLPVIHS